MNRNTLIALVGVLAVVVVLVVLLPFGRGNAVTNDEPCVPQEAVAAYYTDWTNYRNPVRTEDNVPPAADTDTVRYVAAGTVDETIPGGWDNSVITFYTWTGGPFDDAPPVYATPNNVALHAGWNATNGAPNGGPHAGAALYTPYNVSNNDNGKGSWFLKAGVYVPASTDTDYLWQKQVRTFVPAVEAVECPETETPTPTETPTVNTPVETPEVITPTPETPVEAPEEETPVSTPAPENESPVKSTTTHHSPHKTVKVFTHEDGTTSREVIKYPKDAVEEGL